MASVDLPSRAKPEALHTLCRYLRTSEGIKKTDLYNKIDIDQRQIRASLDYGTKLGFLTIEDNYIENTGRGSGLGYAVGSDAAQEVFQEAIESYEPYRETFLRLHARDVVEDVNGNAAIKQNAFKAKAEASTGTEPSDRQINLLIKTAQAGGLGKFITGRKGFETRLEVSDEYQAFVDTLADNYPTPESENTVEESSTETVDDNINQSSSIDEIVLNTDQLSGQLKLKVEYDVTNKSEEDITKLVQYVRSAE